MLISASTPDCDKWLFYLQQFVVWERLTCYFPYYAPTCVGLDTQCFWVLLVRVCNPVATGLRILIFFVLQIPWDTVFRDRARSFRLYVSDIDYSCGIGRVCFSWEPVWVQHTDLVLGRTRITLNCSIEFSQYSVRQISISWVQPRSGIIYISDLSVTHDRFYIWYVMQ